MKKTMISVFLVILLLNTTFLALAIAKVQYSPPEPPSLPWGPTENLKKNTNYTYSVQVGNNPSGNMVYIWFDWGDGSDFTCAGLFSSGAVANCGHKWDETGTFSIRAKAEDKDTGQESDWGPTLTIIVKKSLDANSYNSQQVQGQQSQQVT